MCRVLWIGFIVCLGTGTAGAQGGKDDQQAFQGKWKVVKAEVGGGINPPPDKMPVFTFTGGRFKVEVAGQFMSEGRYTMDVTKQPKQLDMVIESDTNKAMIGKTVGAIYDFRGPQLVMCLKEPGMGRPTEFKASGPSQVLAILEKVKE
jgi:uncharacterized protein (TIGR03067 family)